jgi:hypothetical protein
MSALVNSKSIKLLEILFPILREPNHTHKVREARGCKDATRGEGGGREKGKEEGGRNFPPARLC